MRVALVSRRAWPALGGVERVGLELGRALAAHGHDVVHVAQRIDDGELTRFSHLFTEGPRFAPFEREGARVRQFRPTAAQRAALAPLLAMGLPQVGRRPRGRLAMARWYSRAVGRLLRARLEDAEVVHILGGDFLAYAAVDAAHAIGARAVISPFAHPGEWGDDEPSASAYRRADAVIATLRADAGTYERLGVAADRLHVVGPPVPALPREPRPPEAAPDGPLFVHVGSRRPNKGVGLLLAAARLLADERPGVRIAVVGPGPPLRDAPPNVLDVGLVDDEARAAWVGAATALTLLSDSETFGLVVAEAWTLGVPVVASDIAVLSELVGGAGGGVVSAREPRAVADALAALADDPARVAALGASGRARWAEAYAPHVVAERLTRLY